jgi:recombination protein RecT
MSQEIANTWDAYMAPWEPEFTGNNKYGLSFESECHFAKQLLLKNPRLLQAAQANPASLHDAIINGSACGVSLNPAARHGYLVPRKGVVCLDISFMGLVALACDAGTITLVVPTLVHGARGNYPGDSYQGRGPVTPPLHEYNLADPDRINGKDPLENLLCGYCLAVLPDSQFPIVTEMSATEIYAVRDSSMAKSGPWQGPWSGEMAKKTLIKRASKSWPQGGGRERLDQAIHVINQHEGLQEISSQQQPVGEATAAPVCITHQQYEDIHGALRVSGLTEEVFCRKAGILALENLPETRFEGAKKYLQQQATR